MLQRVGLLLLLLLLLLFSLIAIYRFFLGGRFSYYNLGSCAYSLQ